MENYEIKEITFEPVLSSGEIFELMRTSCKWILKHGDMHFKISQESRVNDVVVRVEGGNVYITMGRFEIIHMGKSDRTHIRYNGEIMVTYLIPDDPNEKPAVPTRIRRPMLEAIYNHMMKPAEEGCADFYIDKTCALEKEMMKSLK